MQYPLFLSTGLAQRYFAPIDRVCQVIAHHAALDRAIGMMLSLVWTRLRRMLVRLDRLAQRWQAGENLAPRPKSLTPARPAPADRKPRMRAGTTKEMFAGVKLPRRRFWLLQLCQPTSFGIHTVEQMLADPEIKALCAAAPQAGRLLRPLCHMYGIKLPAWLQLPPRPRKPKPQKPPRHPKFMHPDDRPVAARYFTTAQRSRLRRLGYIFKTEP